MPIFFVHIPKTAGTSFRLGAEKYFGKSKVWYDYGEQEKETSDAVRAHLYQGAPDVWPLRKELKRNDIALLGGHVSVGKYVSLLGVVDTVTFVRDPLQRMASEYQHFVRHHGYANDFKTFYSRPVMHNRLHKFLQGVDPEAFGFVGLTESYGESLEMLNARYDTSVPSLEANRGKGDVELQHELSVEDVKELKRLNQRDIFLHQKCRSLFETRLGLYRDDLPYAHSCLVEASTQRISGWAWWARSSDAPVAIEIWVNAKKLKTVKATELRPNLCRLRPPRGGYVGYHLTGKFYPGDLVQCRVADTGQWFPDKPRRVPEPEGR